MNIPYTHVLKRSFSWLIPQHKSEWLSLGLQQAAYTAANLYIGDPSFLFKTQLNAAVANVARNPSNKRLESILHFYDKHIELPKKKFSLPAAGLAAGITAVTFGVPMIENTQEIYEGIQAYQGVLPSKALMKDLVSQAVGIELITGLYHLCKKRLLPGLHASLQHKEELFEATKFFFGSSSSKQSHTKNGLELSYYFETAPEKALAKTIRYYYDEGGMPESFSKNVPIEIKLEQLSKKPLSSFVESLFERELEPYQYAVFTKAVKEAQQKNDLQALSLLGVYDFFDSDGDISMLTRTFQEILKRKDLQETQIGKGSKATVTKIDISGKEGPAGLLYAIQYSLDEKIIHEKYWMLSTINEYCKNDSPEVLGRDYDFASKQSVLHVLQMRHPLLSSELAKRPELYEEGYDQITRLSKCLVEYDMVDLEPLDVVEKYLQDPLLDTVDYERYIHSTAQLYATIEEQGAILDYHSDNVGAGPHHLIYLDPENKGTGPKMIDLVNLLDYSYDTVPQQIIKDARTKLFARYQEELNIADETLEELFLYTLANRRDSWYANWSHPDSPRYGALKGFLTHAAVIFQEHMGHSPARDIAKQQLEITNSLYSGL